MMPACLHIMLRTRSANWIESSSGCISCGSMYHTSATTAHDVISLSRYVVKLMRRECQKVSAKILLYLIAIGHTLHPRSKAPFLNMTQYSLLTHVPSGKMSNGSRSGLATCSRKRRWTISLSLLSVRLNRMQWMASMAVFCMRPSHPLFCCAMELNGDTWIVYKHVGTVVRGSEIVGFEGL